MNLRLKQQQIHILMSILCSITRFAWQLSNELMLNVVKSFIGLCLHILNECDIISFEKDSSEGLPGLVLDVYFKCIIQHQIHILIETNNVSFNSQIILFIEPDLNSCSILQISEDQVNWLNQNLLDFFLLH